jgi:hypothetical protein
MSLQETIRAALKDAIRARDEVRMSSLRLVMSAVKLKEKDVRHPLGDEETLGVISSQIKQRREAIEQYRTAGRQDLVTAEENELQVLQGFMPEQLSGEELERAVEEIIAEVGAVGMKDMGKVMKTAMAKLAGRADGSAVHALVRSKLGG